MEDSMLERRLQSEVLAAAADVSIAITVLAIWPKCLKAGPGVFYASVNLMAVLVCV